MRSRNASMKGKNKIFNGYVLLGMGYGGDIWAMNKVMEKMIAVNRHKMECIMLGISLRDQKHNTWIHQKTETEDIVTITRRSEHRFAGQVARFTYNRWTIRATEWSRIPWKRSRGRPNTRWYDNLTHNLGSTWPLLLHVDCTRWRQSREGFLLRE